MPAVRVDSLNHRQRRPQIAYRPSRNAIKREPVFGLPSQALNQHIHVAIKHRAKGPVLGGRVSTAKVGIHTLSCICVPQQAIGAGMHCVKDLQNNQCVFPGQSTAQLLDMIQLSGEPLIRFLGSLESGNCRCRDRFDGPKIPCANSVSQLPRAVVNDLTRSPIGCG